MLQATNPGSRTVVTNPDLTLVTISVPENGPETMEYCIPLFRNGASLTRDGPPTDHTLRVSNLPGKRQTLTDGLPVASTNSQNLKK